MNMNISQETTGRGARLGAGALVLLLCAALLALAVPATSVAEAGPDGRVAEAGADPTAHQYADRVSEVEQDPAEGLPARVAGTLPVTGIDLLVLAVIAGLLVVSGTMIRRLATPRE